MSATFKHYFVPLRHPAIVCMTTFLFIRIGFGLNNYSSGYFFSNFSY